MFGRTILGVLAVIALVGLVAVIGTSVYNAGISQGIAEAANAAAASGDPVVVYPPYVGGHYGYGHGGMGLRLLRDLLLDPGLLPHLRAAARGLRLGPMGRRRARPRWLGVAAGSAVGAPPRASSARGSGATTGCRMTAMDRAARASVARPRVA